MQAKEIRLNRTALLEKFEGKGAWTYIRTPEIKPNPAMPFGWVVVSGLIDNYALEQVKLMPLGDGTLFLAVKAAIRKEIKKEAGDTVKLLLYSDTRPTQLPDELLTCFKYEPKTSYEAFLGLRPSEQKAYIDWIFSAKTSQTKVKRIVELMNNLQKL